MKRIVITGSSGYLGRKLVSALQSQGACVLGIDVNAADADEPDEFHQGDVRSAALLNVIKAFKPDTMIHSAFLIKQSRDGRQMHDINVGGTKNLVRIADEVKPERFLFFSSATALGAWPDNPVPIPDGTNARARTEYQYAAEKADLETDIQDLASRHSDMSVSWVRPSIVGGPRMDNFLSRFIFTMPFMIRLDGYDHPIQFVHEDDVVGAVQAILASNGRGPFNLGPPNHTTVTEIAGLTKRLAISVPFWMAYATAWVAWQSRFWLHESPPGFLYFGRYPWVVSPDRLTNEIGYTFRFSSTEVMLESFQHQAKVTP
ncbi:NAD-dependent epimerase/dehydratase family protein [Fuerstiella marisgermanici]|uniref:UDP-glucose 4-epimerase n=1 Tax=Fuerstiella marisgermanici TaxID=1891926 RepID=A0A1P8WEX9_9PLAN|nr:NAD-dependent epimerase/dehydratase family protein [Fuerstiella marisgermanici]APZ92614.1 UDP-glucose 4-epimerase [Fuerstiella marisgermanici]